MAEQFLSPVSSPVKLTADMLASPMSGVSFRTAKTNSQKSKKAGSQKSQGDEPLTNSQKLSDVTSAASLLRTTLSNRAGVIFPVARLLRSMYKIVAHIFILILQVSAKVESEAHLEKSGKRCCSLPCCGSGIPHCRSAGVGW